MPIYYPTIHCGLHQLKECNLGTLEQVAQLNLYHPSYVWKCSQYSYNINFFS